MTFIIVISFFILLYFIFTGLSEYLDASSQELEIKAKEYKVKNQTKLKGLAERTKKIVEENEGWYTIDYIDDYVEANLKEYKGETT